jgi:hypothetical protein
MLLHQPLLKFFTISLFILFSVSAFAQTTYIGPNNGSWSTVANWNNGLPGPGNNGLIPGGGVNVILSTPLTLDFNLEVYSSLTASSPITISAAGNFAAAGTLVIDAGGSITNNGVFNNFGTATFAATSTFTNAVSGTFTNGGSFTLPGTLNNSGSVTNNGTLNANNGLIQTQGTFSNNQTMTVKSLTINANSTFVNNFGANLTVSGTGAAFVAAGSVTNNGTVNLAALSTISGTFDNNVTLNVQTGGALTVTTTGRINNGGTVLNQASFTNEGTVFNNNNFYNEGTGLNKGTFAQNNRLENRLSGTWTNETASTMDMGFGAVILNAGTFTQKANMVSTGTITNDGIFNLSGSITNNSGGTIDNNKTFTNTGTITSFNSFVNDDVFNNDGTISIGSGSILTNNKTFNNNSAGFIRNEFEIVNKVGGTFTNRGKIENIIRIFVDGGTFSNLSFIDNAGDIFTKVGGTLSNAGYLQQSAGNIQNKGALTNAGTLYSDDCSTINNTGSINNTGTLTLRAILLQRGTLTGTAIANDGGYIHTAAGTNAPAVCANESITADVSGIVKAYATGLIAFANFDSCQNMIYKANGLARPTFGCSDIGTVQNLNIVLTTRLADTLTCIAQVTPTDILAPDFANCPSDITVTTPNNTANVTWTAPTVTDNCTATPTLTVTQASGTAFNIGVTAVTYTATDARGNVQQCQFRVNLIKIGGTSNCTSDVTGPVFTGCPSNLNIASDFNSLPVYWQVPTVADACQPLSVSANYPSGTTLSLGKTLITYTAKDGNNNTSTCQFQITIFKNDLCITDTEKPVYQKCPTNIYQPTNAALNGALVIWSAPQVGDNCAITEQLSTHQSGTVFPVGNTTVTFTAKDGSNNTATCQFTVTIGADPCPGDATGPVITACPVAQTKVVAVGNSTTATWTAPSANDACGPVSLTSDYASGASFSVGITKVTYTATDRKGNKTTCAFNITINTPCSADATSPVISGCPANITVGTTGTSAAASWALPVASDPCGVAGFNSSYSSGAIFPVGVTQVVYTASDFKGNTASCIFNVQVVTTPTCTTNGSPINNATAVATASLDLTWNTAAGASRYDVYLGLTSTTTKLVAPDVVSTSLNIKNLNGGTDYFWYVVPKNIAGTASACTAITKFTTAGTPQGGGTYAINNALPICKGTTGLGLTRQTWTNIPGEAISVLTTNVNYPNTANVTEIFAGSRSIWDATDNYGTRMRGFITPTVTGNYTFNITGDDQVEFYIAQNDNPANKFLAASIAGYTGINEFTKYPSQTSAPIFLSAGQNYYVELLQKEGGGGDGWSIHWTPPGATQVQIPLSVLSPITNDCGTPGTSTTAVGAASRVTNGLVALYNFKETSGAIVNDVSGFGTPLNLTIANTANVTRLTGSCGLRINTATVIKPAAGVSSSKISTAVAATNEITIEAWVKPSNLTQAGPARIASYSQDVSNRNFALGQETSNYVARLRTTVTDANGNPTVLASSVPATTQLQHVVYSRNAAGFEYILVDNELAYEGTRTGTLNFNSAYTFMLGNELTNDRPWLGEMHLVAVYNRALSLSEIGQNYHTGVCTTVNNNVCTQNLIANGGFEKDFFGYWVSNGPTIVTTPVSSGTKAASTCLNESGFGEVFKAVPGQSYTMTSRARLSGTPAWAGLGLRFTDVNSVQISEAQQTVTGTAYTTYTNVAGVAPTNAVWVEMYGWKTGTTGCLLVDDICVTTTTPCANALSVVNNGTCVAKLYRFSGGTETFIADVAAGATRKQSTLDGQVYRIRRSADGALIREYTLSGCNDQTVTITSCGTVGTGGGGQTGCPTDTQIPTITSCPANITVSTTTATSTATWTAPSANDNCGTPLLTSNFVSGATFPIGTTTVRYTAMDTKANTATCQFSVTVSNPCSTDTQAPVFTTCPANQTKTTTAVTTSVTWAEPTVTDNCGAVTVTSTHVSGQAFAPGATIVRYTAVDAKGNTALCSFTVTVTSSNPCSNDTQAPVITLCPSNITQTTATTSAQVNWQSPFVTDNCGLKTFIVNLIPGLIFPLGNTTVSYVATDVFDNKSTCSFVVTVTQTANPCATDAVAPVLSACPANISLTATGTTAVATWTAPTATDNCPGAVTVTSSQNSGAAFAVGTTTVTYTARDVRNNTATCSFTVTVTAAVDPCATDAIAPVLSACPANISLTATGSTAVATWTAPTATDNCPGAVTVTSSHNSGAAFAVGTTTVTYTARDVRNNATTCSFTVTVAPASNPNDCGNIVFTPGSSSIIVSGLTAPVVLIQVFTDQYVGVYSCAGNCNVPTQVINGLAPGTYFIKVDFLDASWTALCKKEAFVTVTTTGGGTGVLTFNAPANITVTAPAGQNQTVATYPTPTATTTCTTGSLSVIRSSGLASGAIFPVGTSEVCYTATDGCGNTKQVCFNVVVNATGTGTGDCNDITITPSSGTITVGGLVSPITYLQVYDGQFNQVFTCAGNCASPTQVVGNLAAGTYFVKATLATANWAPICSKEVFINVTGGGPTSVLTYNAPANITVQAAPNATSAAVTYQVPTATSTCATGTISYLRTQGLASGASFPVGTTRICYTATDGCGSTKSVCFDIIVQANVTGGGPDCNTITFTQGVGSITIGNLAAPVVMIQLFDGAYSPVASCVGNCNQPSQVFSGLTAGTYYVKVDFLNAQWQPICQRNETVSLTSALIANTQIGFTASKQGATTILKWLSNTGDQNDYFEVEKSVDGLNFTKLLEQDGKGAANEIMYFNGTDHQPASGDNFYRLRQVMRDGSVHYSDVRVINFGALTAINVFPNPTSDYFKVDLVSLLGKVVQMSLYTAQGQLVGQERKTADDQVIEWNTTDLESGVYLLNLDIEGQRSEMIKIVIAR